LGGYGGWWWWCLEAWEVGRFGWGGARQGGEPRRAFYRRGEIGSGKKNLPSDPAGSSAGGATTDLEWRRDELLVQAR
jgi:hypothetical protein